MSSSVLFLVFTGIIYYMDTDVKKSKVSLIFCSPSPRPHSPYFYMWYPKKLFPYLENIYFNQGSSRCGFFQNNSIMVFSNINALSIYQFNSSFIGSKCCAIISFNIFYIPCIVRSKRHKLSRCLIIFILHIFI